MVPMKSNATSGAFWSIPPDPWDGFDLEDRERPPGAPPLAPQFHEVSDPYWPWKPQPPPWPESWIHRLLDLLGRGEMLWTGASDQTRARAIGTFGPRKQSFAAKRAILEDAEVADSLKDLLRVVAPPDSHGPGGKIDEVRAGAFCLCFDSFDDLLSKLKDEVLSTIIAGAETLDQVLEASQALEAFASSISARASAVAVGK